MTKTSADNAGRPITARTFGFTLIELLVVVGVIAALLALAVPAFNSTGGSGNFVSQVYNLAETLQEARAFALANSTYVLAGIAEVSAMAPALSTSGTPLGAGTGRVVIAILASNNGVRPYNAQNLVNWASSGYGTGGAFITVTKLASFNNLHLVDLQSGASQPSTSGNMMRPTVPAAYDIPNVSGTAATVIGWPLGQQLASASYVFTKVIEFDPQGSARVITTAADFDSIVPEIEIGFQPSNGTVAPAAPTGSQNTGMLAAIQIDGMTGASHIYRP